MATAAHLAGLEYLDIVVIAGIVVNLDGLEFLVIVAIVAHLVGPVLVVLAAIVAYLDSRVPQLILKVLLLHQQIYPLQVTK